MANRRRKNPFIFFFLFIVLLLCIFTEYNCTETAERRQVDSNFKINEDLDYELVHIGVILDLESRDGMIINSCISMAISDFYNLHDNYSTRLVLHTRDSKGESSQAVIHGKCYLL